MLGYYASLAAETWTPAKIPGNRLWVMASRVVFGSGSAIATETDLSGLANDVTQATPLQRPVQVAGVANGQPGARFDGGDDSLGIATMLGMPANATRWYWQVSILSSLLARTPVFLQGESGSAGNYLGFDANTGGTVGARFGIFAPNNTYDSDLATDLAIHLHVLTVNPAVGTPITGSLTYIVDGTTRVLTPRIVGIPNWAAMGAWNATTYGRYPGIGIFAGATVLEGGAADGLPSAALLSRLRSYCRSKYNTP